MNKQEALNVAILQPNIVLGGIAANLAHCEALLDAQPLAVDLLILPEMFSTGFSMDVKKYAEPHRGGAFQWLEGVAASRKFAVIAGIMVEEDGKYYNRLYVVYPNGEYAYYDKRHLFAYGGESKHYTSGSNRLVISYLGWRICPLICYDLRFPVWSRNRNDYDLLVYIASWPDARRSVWNVLTLARAIENQCYLLASNRVGSDETGRYAGESSIVSPKGELMVSLPPYEEGILTAELSLAELSAFRQKFNVLADADDFTIHI